MDRGAVTSNSPCILVSTMPEKIIHYRQTRGMSQPELATELGVDPSTLSRWENGVWAKSSKTEIAFKAMGIEAP